MVPYVNDCFRFCSVLFINHFVQSCFPVSPQPVIRFPWLKFFFAFLSVISLTFALCVGCFYCSQIMFRTIVCLHGWQWSLMQLSNRYSTFTNHLLYYLHIPTDLPPRDCCGAVFPFQVFKCTTDNQTLGVFTTYIKATLLIFLIQFAGHSL